MRFGDTCRISIWVTFGLLVFEVILGSLDAFVSIWHVINTQKRLVLEQSGNLGLLPLTLYCSRSFEGLFDARASKRPVTENGWA